MKIQILIAVGVLAAAPSIRLVPAVITSCQNGAGQASVVWDSEGRSPVTIYAGRVPMTGPGASSGAAQTGLWVTDGLDFSLRDAAGETLAAVRAEVRCETGGWWPLDVGNEWHFRVNNRAITGAHAVWRVARKERIDDVEWSVLDAGPQGPARLRLASDGRIHLLAADGNQTILLDPNGTQDGTWAVTGRTRAAVTLAGTFGEELTWRGPVAGLGRDSGRLALGVGPTYYQTDVIAGSSGGFVSGYTLLEAVINGARFVPNYPQVGLSLESQTVTYGDKSVRNCTVPCYFVACFGADLPTTYKPCLEASVRGGNGWLALLDPSGTPVFETAANGWVRIPLYREPDTLLAPGRYTVSATVNGSTVTLSLQIR